jgi:hypothetical protein
VTFGGSSPPDPTNYGHLMGTWYTYLIQNEMLGGSIPPMPTKNYVGVAQGDVAGLKIQVYRVRFPTPIRAISSKLERFFYTEDKAGKYRHGLPFITICIIPVMYVFVIKQLWRRNDENVLEDKNKEPCC